MVLGGIRAGGGTDPEVHEDKAGQEEREVGGGYLRMGGQHGTTCKYLSPSSSHTCCTMEDQS